MLTPGGELKVMDFGISRSYAADVTATGGVIGTPAYMAPEQAEGKPTDHRTDIYAFGLILYEMFTGTRRSRGDTPVALALKQIRERARTAAHPHAGAAGPCGARDSQMPGEGSRGSIPVGGRPAACAKASLPRRRGSGVFTEGLAARAWRSPIGPGRGVRMVSGALRSVALVGGFAFYHPQRRILHPISG